MGEAKADELLSPSVVRTEVGGFSNAEADEPNTPRDSGPFSDATVKTDTRVKICMN